MAHGASYSSLLRGFGIQAQELARAVQANPKDPRLNNAYGVMLQQQGRVEESLAYFRAAAQADPKNGDGSYNLARALLTLDRATEALETLDKHPSSSADYHALKGAVLNRLGRSTEAIGPLRRAYQLAPNNQDYAYDLVVTLLKLERPDDAAIVLKKARTLFQGQLRSTPRPECWPMSRERTQRPHRNMNPLPDSNPPLRIFGPRSAMCMPPLTLCPRQKPRMLEQFNSMPHRPSTAKPDGTCSNCNVPVTPG